VCLLEAFRVNKPLHYLCVCVSVLHLEVDVVSRY
jgi:hypothetical protein